MMSFLDMFLMSKRGINTELIHNVLNQIFSLLLIDHNYQGGENSVQSHHQELGKGFVRTGFHRQRRQLPSSYNSC